REPGDGEPPPSGCPALDIRTFGTSISEATYVAHRLREAHLIDHVPWSRMAVIVRSTVLYLAGVRRALIQAGVPTVTEAEDLPLRRQPSVAPLLLLVRCALDPDRLTEETAVALLHSPIGGADPLAERRLRQGLRALAFAEGDPRPSGMLLVEALTETAPLSQVDRRWAAPARAVAEALDAVRAASAGSVEDVLWAAWSASGLADRLASASAAGGPRGESADRDLDAVVALFDAAARFTDRLPGAGAGAFVDTLEGQDLPADSLAPVADRGPAVRVLTAHAAKGLEWDVVAVLGVQEGIWPDLRLRGSILGSETLVDLVAGRAMEPVGRLSALLDEERRLFYVAVTRARRRLIVTAVEAGDSDGPPSRFLGELAGAGGGLAAGQPEGVADSAEQRPGASAPRQLTLPALVAQLRAALAHPDTPDQRRNVAATVLADLAAAGVPGADPDHWWGLAPLSDTRPLAGPEEPVTVTPSTVESIQRCSLRWLLERHGGAPADSPEQGIGNLVHAAAMLAADAGTDRAALAAYVAERFEAIELSARWLTGRERARTDAMLDKLVDWLAGNPRRLLGIEREFLVRLGAASGPVEIRGRVDRLEADDEGRLVVVDLKTGRTAPTGSQLVEHAQLAAYQAAVEAGAFGESRVPGGAMLVQLGGQAAAAREQNQRPLAEAADPTWAQALIERTAATMAAATFEAVANDQCRTCPVRICCPIADQGQPVMG
ncbi:MAG: ATP-dependent DNA helicase, partial [Dactylosporangium sp.]|nr:PD-(D/E)XK nuclease family protein [Dactylosporangium sp.]NNJ59554.1 ATP-dependent DNA helicase [Dactylosporangium sp.]